MKHLRLYESDEDLKHEVYRSGVGTIIQEWWRDANTELHRDDGPAVISYYPDSIKSHESWYRHGERHRDDGPAVIQYWENDKVKYEGWMQNGKFHREDGPSVIEYTELGEVYGEHWYLGGQPYSETRLVNLMLDKWSDIELATIAMQNTNIGYLVRESGKVPDWAKSWINVLN